MIRAQKRIWSGWRAIVKRSLDILMAALGLVLISPLFAAVAAAIRCGSRGPVFFRQERIGRGFQPFQIIKFRTMIERAAELGSPLTAGHHDPRITRVGRLLRRTKIDELPQLINVLKGDMSLVGPRPEIRRYVDLFREDYEYLLTVRPGLTDLASLAYRNEASLLSATGDPEQEYLHRILPDKIALSRQYVEHMSPWLDLSLIAKTLLGIAVAN